MDNKYTYQSPQELSSQQQSPPSDSKIFSLSHKYLAILIVVLCLTSLGSAIYFLTIHNKKDSNFANFSTQPILGFPSPTPTPQEPSEDIEETSDWNIYSSSKYGYSIRHPLDWNAKETQQQDPKIIEYVIFNQLVATKAGELSITLTYTTRAYQEVLAADSQPGETITVASVSSTRKIKQDSQRNVVITVAVPFGGGANTLILYGKETYKDIFNQMLSTLTFTP